MRIILLQNIKDFGRVGDVREVADGYARNFLFPKNLAEPATNENIAKLKEFQEQKKENAEADLLATEQTADQLNGQSVEIKGKINDNGKLYAAITSSKIASVLKKKGFNVKKEQIVLFEPIKEAGEHPVTISLDHGLEAEIIVVVEE